MYEFMGTLTESHLIPSVASLRQYRADELADLTVLYVCALYTLFSSKQTKQFASQYARRTIQHGTQFEQWQSGGTDLYVMLYGLAAPNVVLHDPEDSEHFKSTVPIGEAMLVRWLREMSTGHIRSITHRALFSRLDFNFKQTNSSIKAVRRLVMDWEELSHHEQSLAMTRLIQLLKNRAPKGELLSKLRFMASHHDLEIGDVCDKETGDGCAVAKVVDEKPKKGSLLVNLAAFAAGVAVAGAMDRKKKN